MADTNAREDAQNDDLQETLDVTETAEDTSSSNETKEHNEATTDTVTMPSDQTKETVKTTSVPATNTTSPQATPAHTNTPGVIVLQWLTYAFWGWLILGLTWLISVILISAILKDSVNEIIPYAVAAAAVLLPIAFVTDLLYRKHEPAKKTGIAMVIMVIHAVIFALLGIASLVTAAFVGLNAAINAGDNIDAQIVGLLTAIFAAVLYIAAFARTLNPFKSKVPARIYGFSMLGISILLFIFAIVGPVVQSIASRSDRLIEQNLPSVQREINSYINKEKKLPSSLSDVSMKDEGAKELISKNLVEYIPGTESTVTKTLSSTTTYRYELCVTYAAESNTNSAYYDDTIESDDYKSYLYVYGHDDGRQCYKLKGTSYTYSSGTSNSRFEETDNE